MAKPGSRERRPLGIPTVRDRIVQTALRLVLEPIFDRDVAPASYGFRPQRGCKDALRRVPALLDAGYTEVVDADLRQYVDTIPREPLRVAIRTKVSDGRVLTLLDLFLEQEVRDGLAMWIPDAGTPQGAVITPRTQKVTSVGAEVIGAAQRRREPHRSCGGSDSHTGRRSAR